MSSAQSYYESATLASNGWAMHFSAIEYSVHQRHVGLSRDLSRDRTRHMIYGPSTSNQPRHDRVAGIRIPNYLTS